MLDRATPCSEGGRFVGYVGACVDVQDRRDLDKARNSFLSLMAHEMRSPLSALSTYVEMVRRKVDTGHMPATAMLGKMLRQVRTFSRLITDLSTTAKLEDGRSLDIIPEAMDLEPWLREQVGLFVEESGLGQPDEDPPHAIAIDIEPGNHSVVADGNRMAQALRCVLDNAYKFSPQGGELRVRMYSDGHDRLIAISDPGIGIVSEEIPLVTRRFFRGQNADPKNFRGMGLGLFFAHEILTAHGGHIDVRSTLGVGSTVILVLPRGSIA
jgi:signal transduction histidine kinase